MNYQVNEIRLPTGAAVNRVEPASLEERRALAVRWMKFNNIPRLIEHAQERLPLARPYPAARRSPARRG